MIKNTEINTKITKDNDEGSNVVFSLIKIINYKQGISSKEIVGSPKIFDLVNEDKIRKLA